MTFAEKYNQAILSMLRFTEAMLTGLGDLESKRTLRRIKSDRERLERKMGK